MRSWTATLVLISLMPLWVACGGLFEGSPQPVLGVPYVEQERFNYCVPASIAMWRGYDGLPEMSQDEIWNQLGGAPCDGLDAALGVRLLTNSGGDAYLDLETPALSEDFLARQLASINNRVPVMVIVGPARNHVGVINGGSYQLNASSGYRWNTVLFHDPAYGPNLEYSSSDWVEHSCRSYWSYCGQIISYGASANWVVDLQTFGSQIELYDGTSCCNQEYQY